MPSIYSDPLEPRSLLYRAHLRTRKIYSAFLFVGPRNIGGMPRRERAAGWHASVEEALYAARVYADSQYAPGSTCERSLVLVPVVLKHGTCG